MIAVFYSSIFFKQFQELLTRCGCLVEKRTPMSQKY